MVELPHAISTVLESPLNLALILGSALALVLIGVAFCIVLRLFDGLRGYPRSEEDYATLSYPQGVSEGFYWRTAPASSSTHENKGYHNQPQEVAQLAQGEWHWDYHQDNYDHLSNVVSPSPRPSSITPTNLAVIHPSLRSSRPLVSSSEPYYGPGTSVYAVSPRIAEEDAAYQYKETGAATFSTPKRKAPKPPRSLTSLSVPRRTSLQPAAVHNPYSDPSRRFSHFGPDGPALASSSFFPPPPPLPRSDAGEPEAEMTSFRGDDFIDGDQ